LSNTEVGLNAFRDRGPSARALIDTLPTGHFPSSLIICGAQGMGKTAFARMLSAALLCLSDGQGRPCMACRGCKRVLNGTHPDLLTPDKTDKKSIGVAEIRGILQALGVFATEGGRRVVLIDDADRLTREAQNSMLKTLEEPGDDTFFILTAARENLLLSTIRSRCRTVRLAPMAEDALTDFLTDEGVPEPEARSLAQLSGGSPGLALRLRGDEEDRRMRELVVRTALSLTARSDIPRADEMTRDLKDQADRYLAVLERELQLLAHGRGLHDGLKGPWLNAGPTQFARISQLTVDAERMRASNVNYQAVLNCLFQSIVEEVTGWQQS